MENSLGMTEGGVNDPKIEDGVVILMDPDMILLRPLLHDFTSENVIWAADAGAVLTKVVRHGFPMAQQDGYLRNDWRNLNWTYIMDKPADEYRARRDESEKGECDSPRSRSVLVHQTSFSIGKGAVGHSC